jgi:hypothetical protein
MHDERASLGEARKKKGKRKKEEKKCRTVSEVPLEKRYSQINRGTKRDKLFVEKPPVPIFDCADTTPGK